VTPTGVQVVAERLIDPATVYREQPPVPHE